MLTVGHPGGITFPTGAGIGATHDMCAVMSFTRAAGIFPIITVVEPIAIIPGPAGTHDGSMHGVDMSVTRAAGIFPIITVGHPGGIIVSGSPGCGTGVGTGAGGWIGAWQCGESCLIMSPTRAAAGIGVLSIAGPLASRRSPWAFYRPWAQPVRSARTRGLATPILPVMSAQARPGDREPAQALTNAAAVVPARGSPTPPASITMSSGRSVEVSSGPGGDQIEVRSPDGMVEIRVALTPQGPVLSVSGAKLEINATESVSLNCRDLSINTTGSMNLTAQGSVGIHAADNVAVRSQGNTDIDAQIVNLNCGPRDGYNDDALPKFELPAAISQPPPSCGPHGCCH